jgi:hypothetical protein
MFGTNLGTTCHRRIRTFRILFALATLFLSGSVAAGSLTNLAMTPSVTTVGSVTSYTLTFRAPSVLNNTRVLRVNNAAGPGGNTSYAGATLQSVSGGTLTMNIGLAVSSELFFNITGGTAAANTTITIVVNNITNPLVTSGNGYFVQVEDSNTFNDIDTGTAAGNTYTPNPAPFVVVPIANQLDKEEQSGQYIAVADLNANFDDGDGDPLVFSIQGNTAPSVVTPQIVGSQLRLTPNAFGTASITIRASDNQEGFADDTFIINAFGFLANPSVVAADTIVGRTTTYTLTFNTDSLLSPGDFITFSNAVSGPNQSASILQSVGPGLTGTRTAGGSTATVIRIDSGSVAPGGTVTIVLGGIVNPAAPGTGPQYLVEKGDGNVIEDKARISGTNYVSAPLNIFGNGFEPVSLLKLCSGAD